MSTHEIVCPHCHESFSLTDSAYLDIIQQVKTTTFDKEVRDQVEAAKKLAEKDAELARQKADQAAATEIAKLKADLEAAKGGTKAAVETAEAKALAQVVELKAQLTSAETEKKLAVTEAVAKAEKASNDKVVELQTKASDLANLNKFQKESFEGEIARLKDHRVSLTTQGIGAEFEKWCENEFNKLRAGAFRNSYFERDNQVVEGGKGDYIFRENATSGTEILSIMFEMKNQADESVNTKKNTDFLEKLHKDRVKKGCEYAILVTTLEPDNDLYNQGIVDMSHVHEKMFVIRPQFFISMIILLRNLGTDKLAEKEALAIMKAETLDVTNFEEKLTDFKAGFARNYDLAARQYEDAIASIDKSIKDLEDVKTSLRKSENNLRLANEKAQDVSVRKLTSNNPTMSALFDSARANTPIEGEEVDHEE